MKFGVVIACPDVAFGPLALLSGTFPEKAAKARALGYDGVELMVRDPSQLDIATIRSVLQNNHLEVAQVVTGELFGTDGFSLLHASSEIAEAARKRIASVIDFAAHFGAQVNIGRFRGRLDAFPSREEGYMAALERIGEVADWAAAQGVRITLEPLNRYECDFLFTAEEGIHFIRDLGRPNVGLMLDLFHMNIEEVSLTKSLETAMASGLLWHIHVADSNRRYPGAGHLDILSIWQVLSQGGYTGYVSAELLPLPDPDTAAIRTIHYLRLLEKGGDRCMETS